MQGLRLRSWILIPLVLLAINGCSSGIDESGRVKAAMPRDWEPQLAGSRLAFNWSYSIVQYHGDFWATTWAHDFLGPGMLLRFQPATKTAKQYTVRVEEGTGIPSLLLTTAQGDLWGGGMNPLAPASFRREGCTRDFVNNRVSMPWVLSRYDPKDDRFKPIQDKGGLLRGCEIRALSEDVKGDLWLIVDDGLYSPLYHWDPAATFEQREEARRTEARPRLFRFNPQTAEAVFIDLNAEMDALSLERVNDVLSAPDGTLWIEAQGVDHTQDKVLRYEPETGQVQDLGTPSQQYDYNSHLYLDHQGRLWTSHVGWADVRHSLIPSWHAVDSAVFIFPGGAWPGDTYRTMLFQISESADGRMWFASGAGLMTYDLGKDQWTPATPSASTIVQDENGDIWTAAYGEFYRYKPTH